MKRNTSVLVIAILVAMFTVSVFSAPVATSSWGTVNVRADIIRDLSTLMSTSGNGANGLSVALEQQARKAQEDIAELYAVDTAQLTDEEMADYTQTLTNLNTALAGAVDVCARMGYSSSADALNISFGNLLTYAQATVNADQRFCSALIQPHVNAPVGSTTWGTVNFNC